MAHTQHAVPPRALRQTGLLAPFGGVGEENLAGDREHLLIREALQQWLKEARLHAHVVVQKNHDLVPGLPEAGIRGASETEVAGHRQNFHGGECLPYPIRRAIRRGVVHQDDLVVWVVFEPFDHRRKVLLDEVPSVPRGNHHGRRKV